MTRVFVAALMFGFLFATAPVGEITVAQRRSQKSQRTVKRYACPMHPEVSSTRIRKCPKCGMTFRLVRAPVEAATPANVAAAH